ncbi:uncharacterized protein LOC144173359 [Haemaphysalis longicornis]
MKKAIATINIETTAQINMPSLSNVDTVVGFIHYYCQDPLTARAPNNKTYIQAMMLAIGTWNKKCLSVSLAGLHFSGVSVWGQAASSCTPVNYCKTKQYTILDATSDSITSATSGDTRYAFDSTATMRNKVGMFKQYGCIYVDHLEEDHEDCRCSPKGQKFPAFPLLTAVLSGMS